MGCTWRQYNIGWIVDVDSVKGKEDYFKRCIDKGNDLTPPLYTRGVEVRTMSGVGPMRVQGGRKGFFRKI